VFSDNQLRNPFFFWITNVSLDKFTKITNFTDNRHQLFRTVRFILLLKASPLLGALRSLGKFDKSPVLMTVRPKGINVTDSVRFALKSISC
jgi:hypothetical protein